MKNRTITKLGKRRQRREREKDPVGTVTDPVVPTDWNSDVMFGVNVTSLSIFLCANYLHCQVTNLQKFLFVLSESFLSIFGSNTNYVVDGHHPFISLS